MQISTISALLMEIITIRPTIKQRSENDELLILDSTMFNRHKMETLKRSPLSHFSVGPFNKDNNRNDSPNRLLVELKSNKHPRVSVAFQ